jgi:uncharacterized membrane protein YfcA
MVILALAFVIVLIASSAQAITGFGYAMLAVPLLSVVIDAHTAVVGAALAGLGLSTIGTIQERAHVSWRPTLIMCGTSLLGMPFGIVLLHVLDARALRLLIAGVVLVCTAQVWRNVRLPERASVVGVLGLITGVLATATGTNGPPLVAAFQAMGYEPRRFRATMAATFLLTGVLSLAAFAIGGDVDRASLMVSLAAVPAAIAGWLVGNRVFARIDAVLFRRIVLIALVCASAVTVIRALTG